ncbi:reverse transcriptase [Corchorus capsularis]|uniref:RNA-directed DNA polymerase n=1 Tax=Corchorus capsularis TaxID=210143 RepID=A0A1R3IPP1_COCAP|nr:reverse transcriptase [Corchorus capsularis]
MLVDSGSTHNFLDCNVAKSLKLPYQKGFKKKVIIANGEAVCTAGYCKSVEWEVQGVKFCTNFFILPLHGCDAVLGVQWLVTLGPILWDFSLLTMQFELDGVWRKIQGIQQGHIELENEKRALKSLYSICAKKGPQPSALMIAASPVAELKGAEEMQPQIQAILVEFEELFGVPQGLPPKRLQDHRIPLTDESKAIKVRPYRYPSIQKDELERMIKEMLAAGIIRNNSSSFASPVVMVKKKDGSWRLCVDYRQLNDITIKDKFPIPLVEELLDELVAARWFSKLDWRSGYHQIRMDECDVHKTAFRTHEGHYEFLVMPFGLTNAPATFQSLMNSIFKPYLRKFVLVFFDDILVYSATFEEHVNHLKTVFEILQSNQLFVKKSKCDFAAKEVEYLGQVISNGEVYMDKKKVESILDWPRPKSIRELRGFLGLSGYYRRFIKSYGVLARPLTNLLKKDAFKWGEEADEAFKQLKEGIPIAYFSKGLSPKHQSMSVYDKEMLAVLFAVKKWNSYLLGRHFVIKTDHQSLRFLSSQQATTPAQQKWIAKMMGYSYDVIYRIGATNTVADVLSRKPTDGEGKLVVGNQAELRKELLGYLHNSVVGCHSGINATTSRITSVLYWKGLRKDVKEDISMDFIEGLPKYFGKDTILVVVDRLSKSAHFLALSHPFSAISIAQIFMENVYKLHGMPQSIVSDRDKIFVSKFWQELFKQLGSSLKLSTAYHPQTDGQTEVVNRCLESYLRCMCHESPKEWSKWLHLAEWWYNTTFHSSIQTTPYEAMYGQSPPLHQPYLAGESNVEVLDRSLKARENAIRMLKFYLEMAQNRMKSLADKSRIGKEFDVEIEFL